MGLKGFSLSYRRKKQASAVEKRKKVEVN